MKRITPIKYYGGKQQMTPHILPLIKQDKSTCFVSLFTGGAALEYAKPPHKVEIWNDLLNGVVVFWQTLQTPKLCRMVKRKLRRSVYGEHNFKRYGKIYRKLKNKKILSAKERINFSASMFWMCNCSFAGGIGKGFAFGNTRNLASAYHNKVKALVVAEAVRRLENVLVMQRDALDIFKMFNKPDTLFYADPPYFNSDMGHYGGYTKMDFARLLVNLSGCKGKFILSSYDSPILNQAAIKYGWRIQKIEKQLAVLAKYNTKRTKVECITTNFDPFLQETLF